MSPGAAPRAERGRVISVERLGDLIEVTAELPHLAGAAQPGQFAQLRCGAGPVPLLRRPFSVAWVDAGACAFVLHEVGAGTRLLAALRPGDELDALGPLGRGFTLRGDTPAAVCVSGGVGCAPFPLLVRALRDAGVEDIVVLNGAAAESALYPAERFQRGDTSVRVEEATVDGSAGRRGLVTDLLDTLPAARRAALYACGPNPMLAAVAARLEPDAGWVMAEMSLEAPMGCGFGTCLGCALPMRGEGQAQSWSLCCTDGPVMQASAVDWPALLALPGADVA